MKIEPSNKFFIDKKLFTIGMLAISSYIYIYFSLSALPSSKFNDDAVVPTMIALNFLYGTDFFTYTSHSMKLLGTEIPTNMVTGYMYQLPGLMLIPFFALLGTNIFSFYFMQTFLGMLYIFVLFALLKIMFNDLIALITSVLIATNPSYIHYSSNAFISTEPFINLFFALFLLFCFLSVKRSRLFLLPAALAFGAGFSIKLSYFSRLIALICVYPVFLRKTAGRLFRSSGLLLRAGVILFFIAGASMFLSFNFSSHQERDNIFKMFQKYILEHKPSMTGLNNSNLADNSRLRLSHLKALVNNRSYSIDLAFDYFMKTLTLKDQPVLWYLFLLAMLVNLIHAFYFLKDRPIYAKNVLAVYMFYAIVFILSFFSPATLSEYHMSCMYPFPQLLMAVFINNIITTKLRRELRSALYLPLILFLLYANISGSIFSLYIAKTTDIKIKSVGNMEELYDAIKTTGIKDIFILDRFFIYQLIFLSTGDLNISGNQRRILYDFNNEPELINNNMQEYLEHFKASGTKNALILLYTFRPEFLRLQDHLCSIFKNNDISWEIISDIYNKQGLRLFRLIKLSKKT